MANQKFVYYRLLCIVLPLFVSTFACSSNNNYILYEGDDFTFSAPAGYKTTLYEPPQFDPNANSDLLLFSNMGHYPFFLIYRQEIPPESDLDTVFRAYSSKISETVPSYQFMSQNTIALNNRTAIEYMHCEYLGEPYVQSREIWMEYNGWAYSLVCVHTGNGPCAEISISDQCIYLAESFQFK